MWPLESLSISTWKHVKNENTEAFLGPAELEAVGGAEQSVFYKALQLILMRTKGTDPRSYCISLLNLPLHKLAVHI